MKLFGSLQIVLWMVIAGCYSESVNEETDQSQKTEVEVANEEFERFIASALTNYSDWIKDKNRDPAHVPTESRIKEQNFEIEFVISNHTVTGNFTSPFIETEVDVEQNFLSATRNTSAQCSGTYTINGSIFGDVKFYGQGTFRTNPNETVTETLIFDSFGLTEDKTFVNLSLSNHTYYKFRLSHFGDISFDNIIVESSGSANYKSIAEDSVRERLATLYYDYFSVHYDEHPSGRLLHEYLREILQNTPLSEIAPSWKLSSPAEPNVSQNETQEVVPSEVDKNVTTVGNDTSSLSPGKPDPETGSKTVLEERVADKSSVITSHGNNTGKGNPNSNSGTNVVGNGLILFLGFIILLASNCRFI